MRPPFMLPQDCASRFLGEVERISVNVANAIHLEGARIVAQTFCEMLGVIANKMVQGSDCTKDEFIEMCSSSISHSYNSSKQNGLPDA